MKYSRFELLVLVFGGGAIVGTAAASLMRKTDWVEIVGQLLLLVVLIGALHWGRKGGFAAGILAALMYMGLRVPTITTSGALTPTLAQLLITRAVVFGAVGIVGGEICTRIKYFFLKLEDHDYIDDVTHLYNAAYIHDLFRAHIAQHERYHAVFSIVTLQLDEPKLPPLAKNAGRRVLREVGKAVLGDIRLVDEMGRLDGALFCVILPNTPLEGARVCAARLAKTATSTLRTCGVVGDDIAATDAIGYPEDKERVEAMLPASVAQPGTRTI